MDTEILRNVENPDDKDNDNEADYYKQRSEYMTFHAMHLPISVTILYGNLSWPDVYISVSGPLRLIYFINSFGSLYSWQVTQSFFACSGVTFQL